MDRYRFYNKIVAIGDKSRYLFVKNHISSKYKFEYPVEKLEDKNIYVLYGNEDLIEDDFDEIRIYSKNFPRTKVMILPKNIFDINLNNKIIDKLLIFNSFPYIKQISLDDTDYILKEFEVRQTESILYKEDRKFAYNDLTNENDILEKAIETYKKNSINSIIYKENSLAEELFNIAPNFVDSYKNDYKNRYWDSLEKFKMRYDRVYDSNINNYYKNELYLLNPEGFEQFNEIFEFEHIKGSNDIWLKFVNTFKDNYVQDKENEMESILFKTKELYLYFLEDICFWDKKSDLEELEKFIISTYKDHFGREKVLKAPRNEIDYIKLINESDENSLKVIFNKKLDIFLDYKLKNILKQYIEMKYKQIMIW